MTDSLWALEQISHFLKPIFIVLVKFRQLHIPRCFGHVIVENRQLQLRKVCSILIAGGS
ncbi:MAG: hypothetical protein QG599_1611 [Pseudomonadota bacterium]|nr:hypothetical protein [Pseudomonadota bacterium]